MQNDKAKHLSLICFQQKKQKYIDFELHFRLGNFADCLQLSFTCNLFIRNK